MPAMTATMTINGDNDDYDNSDDNSDDNIDVDD